MRRALLGVIVLLWLTGQSPVDAMAARVRKVHDGDTLTLEDGSRVRLATIDSPELAQPLGPVARNALRDLVAGQVVDLRCKGTTYHRRICRVYLPIAGSIALLDVEGDMVRRGLAYDYTQYSRGAHLYEEQLARLDGIGVWQTVDGGQRPWEYRHRKRPKRSRIKAAVN